MHGNNCSPVSIRIAYSLFPLDGDLTMKQKVIAESDARGEDDLSGGGSRSNAFSGGA